MKTTILTAAALALAATLSFSALAQEPGDAAKPGPRGDGPRGMMQRIDADGDGKITLEEFKAPQEGRFAMLDVNGDGVIDKEEFGARRMARFAERDADGNGVLEGDELAARGPGRGEGRGEGRGYHHHRMGDCPRAK
ncbi:EF-hand domain-containing protein [Thioalkalivibrio sp. XN279]|uniref:EF-hand domain-containing protein n=1 Tax=Thioalkalivibrio sp. XN279 TaxID=2714953 RepID=UPI00140B80FF|nr:EF-hand domain-containing protein [Thioalkalivibrio sp. XN279]NHA13705.1 hypothetical protein [Thioalkalivibrio sp. XN279]